MRRTDDVSLWTWPFTLKLLRNVARIVEYCPVKLILWLFIVDLWATGRRRAPVGGAIRHRYRSIAYSSSVAALDGGNWQITIFGEKILDLESDFENWA